MNCQRDASSTSSYDRSNVEVRKDAHGGSGSFATRDIDLNRAILQTDSNYGVNALSDARLKDTCYHCLVGQVESGCQTIESPKVPSLKVCSGCRTVRYCSSKCQKSSWTDAHKRECKIFKKLYPRVLPSNVRAVLRLLLVEDAANLHLKRFLKLQDHLNDLEESGGQRWQDLCLSAKATKVYSATKHDEATILRLFGILQTNSFTLVTVAYDPIGLALHPALGYFNHSCEFNATVRFGKYGNAELIPIRPIEAGEEILISYVDEVLPYVERQAELEDRYFFSCQCSRCKHESAVPISRRLPAAQEAYDAGVKVLAAPTTQIKNIVSALAAIRKADWKITSYPMPSLLQLLITTYLSEGMYRLGFVHAMMQSFLLDPVLYSAPHHPIRMVHAWLCVRVVDELLESRTEVVSKTEDISLTPFNIDLGFWLHAIVISLHRSANAVAPGEFSNMVDSRYNENRAHWTGSEKAYQEQYTGKRILEAKWANVQSAIDHVTKMEKGT